MKPSRFYSVTQCLTFTVTTVKMRMMRDLQFQRELKMWRDIEEPDRVEDTWKSKEKAF